MICSLHRESLQGAKRLELKDMTSGKITVVPLRSLLEVREVVMKKEKDSLHSFEVRTTQCMTFTRYSVRLSYKRENKGYNKVVFQE